MGHPAIGMARQLGSPVSLLVALMLGLVACQPLPQPVATAVSAPPPKIEPATAISLTPSITPTLEPTIIPASPSPASLPAATEQVSETSISPGNVSRLEQIGMIRYAPWELVLALAWSPDGNILAVSTGNSIVLYSGSGLSQLQVLEVGAWTSGLAFGPDGSLLAAGSRDGELRIWRRLAGAQTFGAQPSLQWSAHKKGINRIAFSLDGFYLASGGNDAIARIWRVVDGTLEQQMIGGTFSVTDLSFQPGASNLAIVNGSLARLRTLDTGRIGTTLRGDVPLFSLAFSPDGRWIATGNLNNQLDIWEADTGERVARLEAPPGVPDAPAAFSGEVVYSPDGGLLGAAASDGTIRLWEPVSGQLYATLSGHGRAATCLAFSPDQVRLVSGGLDATIRVWGIR